MSYLKKPEKINKKLRKTKNFDIPIEYSYRKMINQYINKFKILTNGIISKSHSEQFINLVQNLKHLKAKDLLKLNPIIKRNLIRKNDRKKGIF